MGHTCDLLHANCLYLQCVYCVCIIKMFIYYLYYVYKLSFHEKKRDGINYISQMIILKPYFHFTTIFKALNLRCQSSYLGSTKYKTYIGQFTLRTLDITHQKAMNLKTKAKFLSYHLLKANSCLEIKQFLDPSIGIAFRIKETMNFNFEYKPTDINKSLSNT